MSTRTKCVDPHMIHANRERDGLSHNPVGARSTVISVKLHQLRVACAQQQHVEANGPAGSWGYANTTAAAAAAAAAEAAAAATAEAAAADDAATAEAAAAAATAEAIASRRESRRRDCSSRL